MPLFTICLVVISKKFFIPQKTAWHYIKEGYMAHNFQKVILIRGSEPNFFGSQWCIIDHHDGVHNANLQITFSEIQILQNVNL